MCIIDERSTVKVIIVYILVMGTILFITRQKTSLNITDQHKAKQVPKQINALTGVISNRSRAWTVLTYANMGFMSFLDNWLTSVERLGIRYHFTIVARDNASYRYINDKWEERLNITVDAAMPIGSAFFTFNTKNYIQFVNSKPSLILQYLQRGLDILFTDLDMVWLQNPMDFIPHGYDLHIMREVYREPQFLRAEKLNICTGFMFIASNDKTINFIKEWIIAINKQPNKIDQDVFNTVFYKSNTTKLLKINVLEFRRFVSGKHYFDYNWRKLHAGVKPAVVHNNWIRGSENKMNRFKKAGLWYI